MDLDKTGKFIAKYRKIQHLTQKQLANKLGINDKTISKWERGVNAPDISILVPLAKCLDVEVQEILNGQKSQKISKKTNQVFIFNIIFLIIITTLLFVSYNKHIVEKDFYYLTSDNKNFYVKGFIVVNDDKYIISVNKIDYINKLDGNIDDFKLKEIKVKVFNNDELLYYFNKIKEKNDNNNLYFPDFLNDINFVFEDKKDLNDLHLKILIDYQTSNDKYEFISINLSLKE